MTTEFAGAIEIGPPLSGAEVAYVRRLAADDDAAPMPWAPARDGTTLRPHGASDLEEAVVSLRLLVGTMERPSRLRGTVAAYDVRARDLLAITVANGRVTVRALRRARAATQRSNVIDLASHRRTISRAIG
jgi:hypothetical protein